ncbi:cytochrome b/b6 domain-containing protein [Leucobacter denitrificans]|uniref:Cytochrome b/b6 domain-containing protein n=1 Tax=Leucobacter denitrificans TaxID=683042 RepID=A0A7G9S2A3_9MICO|nr:cytochrome b/b6 domain-containing protein [Leucobacter denitrificans]QNN61978.1 cytochrome b/b6 domain-containing protein [Leucobacter denitrificans]
MGASATVSEAAPANRTRMADAPAASAQRTRMGAATVTPQPEVPAEQPAVPATASQNATEPGKRWLRRAIFCAILVAAAVGVVLVARWLRTLPEVQQFLTTYPGHVALPESAPVGLPAWIGWQHFFNMFFMVLIVRTGLQVRLEKKSPGYWKPKERSFFSPRGATPKKVSLTQWVHQSLDVLWVVNGIVFVVLLLVTGHWQKIVPTSWEFFPNALSSGLQYASLNWPLENGWIHYNALQVFAYFITVFIAAPFAVISGIRFSTWWPDQHAGLTKIYPVEIARAIHFPVMLYFVGFTIVHIFLVFFTGALRNLNHMFTSRDVVDWWGLAVFGGSLVVIAAAWWLTQPIFIRPIAARTGTLSK